MEAGVRKREKDRLLRKMEAQNIVKEFHNYVKIIMTQCTIQLRFDNHTLQPFSLPNGCCQGCPLSMLLYIIYNTPLINITDSNNPNECIVGFVDDTTLLACGKDFGKAHSTIKDMMECINRVFKWSSTFNSPLEMNKLALVNFMQLAIKASEATDLVLTQKSQGSTRTHQIKASHNAKLLGVLLNS